MNPHCLLSHLSLRFQLLVYCEKDCEAHDYGSCPKDKDCTAHCESLGFKLGGVCVPRESKSPLCCCRTNFISRHVSTNYS
ncbi:hypothetical protein HID58_063311 [Brassica napus]|uniref:Defensin-like protein n=1 Tax=Brassica napus TaxID=3708 RepID=A0ABQ8A562_BRANA|nr:hypothetical protein HID58_063311 [Brassica napus]